MELSQLKLLALQVSKYKVKNGQYLPYGIMTHFLSLSIGHSDYQEVSSTSVTINGINPSSEIRLFANNDEITLEYEDKVQLRFTPTQAGLIPGLASNYEYLRDTISLTMIVSTSPL